MTQDVIITLFAGILVGIIAQSSLMWFKLGRLERAVKRSCPFGECPLFKRAKNEAAPERTETANV